jgi:hypothetical protein
MRPYTIITYCIAFVWLANGLFCKVLNLVPRHQEIVARILGNEHDRLLTVLIGGAEIIMALWVVSRYKQRLNAALQIIVVATMNTIEFFTAPDLLLWGKFNAVIAFIFVVIVYLHAFQFSPKR